MKSLSIMIGENLDNFPLQATSVSEVKFTSILGALGADKHRHEADFTMLSVVEGIIEDNIKADGIMTLIIGDNNTLATLDEIMVLLTKKYSLKHIINMLNKEEILICSSANYVGLKGICYEIIYGFDRLKDGKHIYIIHDDNSLNEFDRALEDIKVKLKNSNDKLLILNVSDKVLPDIKYKNLYIKNFNEFNVRLLK